MSDDIAQKAIQAIQNRRLLAASGVGLACACAAVLLASGNIPAAALSGWCLAIYAPLIRWAAPDDDQAVMNFGWFFFGLFQPAWAMMILVVLESLIPNFAGVRRPTISFISLIAVVGLVLVGGVRIETPRRTSLVIVAVSGALATGVMLCAWPNLNPRPLCAAVACLHVGIALALNDFVLAHPLNRFETYGLCAACAYDLRGSTVDRCPECGKSSSTLSA